MPDIAFVNAVNLVNGFTVFTRFTKQHENYCIDKASPKCQKH